MHKSQRRLIDGGYQAGMDGKTCEASTCSERDRAAWGQGWRAGKAEARRLAKSASPITNPLADPDNWTLHYIESLDEHRWVYNGPEAQPWMIAFRHVVTNQ
jgi:ribosome modulation factor